MDKSFYKKAADYWSSIPPTLEGVLGGFGFISEIDLQGSKKFLDAIFSLENPPSKTLALDCGAGIGRVTKGLLIEVFDKVDMIDQNVIFLDVAKESIEPKEKIGCLYSIGLQDFKADKEYDLIWSQWVLGHLTDKDFISFFSMCRSSIANNGIIVVKENVTSSGELEKDNVDSSVTRSLKHLTGLFKKSDLRIVKYYKQNNFPQGLYPVYIFALRPLGEPTSPSGTSMNKKTSNENDQLNKDNADDKQKDNSVNKLAEALENLNVNKPL